MRKKKRTSDVLNCRIEPRDSALISALSTHEIMQDKRWKLAVLYYHCHFSADNSTEQSTRVLRVHFRRHPDALPTGARSLCVAWRDTGNHSKSRRWNGRLRVRLTITCSGMFIPWGGGCKSVHYLLDDFNRKIMVLSPRARCAGVQSRKYFEEVIPRS